VQRFATVTVVDPRGWLLMQERDEFPVIDPEKWGFPGGMVEPGESFVQAAYRELEEETGIHLEDGLELFAEFRVFHAHSGSEDEVSFFVAPTWLTDADVECHEGRQMVFVDPALARGLDLTAAASITLPAFLDSPVYRSMCP
jgi:8-oxo-dGTP diphosphatase